MKYTNKYGEVSWGKVVSKTRNGRIDMGEIYDRIASDGKAPVKRVILETGEIELEFKPDRLLSRITTPEGEIIWWSSVRGEPLDYTWKVSELERDRIPRGTA